MQKRNRLALDGWVGLEISFLVGDNIKYSHVTPQVCLDQLCQLPIPLSLGQSVQNS